MIVNVGKIDRIIRISLGIITVTLAALGYFSYWGFLGILLIISGLLKNCTFYSLIGINTLKK
jgi:Protein of unknown function (DUF2892)